MLDWTSRSTLPPHLPTYRERVLEAGVLPPVARGEAGREDPLGRALTSLRLHEPAHVTAYHHIDYESRQKPPQAPESLECFDLERAECGLRMA